jgi:hypothetical protein
MIAFPNRVCVDTFCNFVNVFRNLKVLLIYRLSIIIKSAEINLPLLETLNILYPNFLSMFTGLKSLKKIGILHEVKDYFQSFEGIFDP